MDSYWVVWVTGAATFLATFWRTALTFVQQIRGRVIATAELNNSYLCDAFRAYLWEHATRSAYVPRSFTARILFRRDTDRHSLVPLERIDGSQLYWLGWVPLWVSLAPVQGNERAIDTRLTVCYLRGTLNIDQLLLRLAQAHDAVSTAVMSSDQCRRFYIRTVHGTGDGLPTIARSPQPPSAVPSTDGDSSSTGDYWDLRRYRLIGATMGLFRPTTTPSNALDQLVLDTDALSLVAGARRWLLSKDWYAARGIPWRYGAALVGAPGTGKTSLLRAIAHTLDMPVCLFDLRTLRNRELLETWHDMLMNTPCMAVFEDIDAVFDKRTNRFESGLSFDCLLNCLDGLKTADGVMTAATTNNADALDPALLRPGRLTRVVTLGPMSTDGRQRLAQKILVGYDAMIPKLVAETEGLPPAAVQEAFCQAALAAFWECESLLDPAPVLPSGVES